MFALFKYGHHITILVLDSELMCFDEKMILLRTVYNIFNSEIHFCAQNWKLLMDYFEAKKVFTMALIMAQFTPNTRL